ncbi:MAG: DUF4349 domain-containing protein [Oscillospiraceae bacterium]|nr:DUF4349 domain-containing protein [Oscillospiraceae bacterium]
MRKHIRSTVILLLALALLCGFAACGVRMEKSHPNTIDLAMPVPSANYEADMEEVGYVVEQNAVLQRALADVESAGGPADSGPAEPKTGARKLIKDVSAAVETKQFDSYIETIKAKAAAMGGHVQSSSINGYGYGDESLRWASLVLRVPAAQLEAFQAALEDEARLTRMNESIRDVTMEYTDVEANIRALQTERDALLGMMERSGALEDLIRVQERLSEVRYRLDSLESQLRQLGDLVDLSTVTLDVQEVQRIAPPRPDGFWKRAGSTFVESLRSIGRGIQDILGWLLGYLPYLLLAAAAVAVCALLVRRRRRKRRASKA